MDVVEGLSEGSHASLNQALDRYLDARVDLIQTATSVHGSFLSEIFLVEMQDGSIALLEGLLEANQDQAISLFDRATKQFEAMGLEGGIELADDYIRGLERQGRVDAIAGLFPEDQESLLGPFNKALGLYNQVLRGAFGSPEGRQKVMEAVRLLRKVELKLGGFSSLDVEKRVHEQRQGLWEAVAGLAAMVSIVFAIAQIVAKLGGLRVVAEGVVRLVR
jgi:hypothetical protein